MEKSRGNKSLRLLTIILALVLYACGPSNQNAIEERRVVLKEESSAKPNDKVSKSINYDSLLSGLWYSDGNVGMVSEWLEFDSQNHNYFQWLTDEDKPGNHTGTYAIIPGRQLELRDEQFNEIQKFSIDSLSAAHLDLGPFKPSAGNLVYRRTPHKIIFFHLSDHEFDSLVSLPQYQGLYEMSSDFGFYAGNVLDSLSKTKIKAEITSDRFIMIGTTRVDKFKYSGYGAILIRTDSISIQPGVMTDLGYYQLIEEFYK